jgi:glycerol-3-phosphate cytidylyltransferase
MTKKELVIGYTTGVYDLFHIGHLNLLKRAKEQCDYLIVGITSDEAAQYKNKKPFIPQEERMEIVAAIKYVDKVVLQDDLDKVKAWHKYHYDKLFVGSDWQGTEKWNKYERDLKEVGASVIYFPYTKTTSSTILQNTIRHFNQMAETETVIEKE